MAIDVAMLPLAWWSGGHVGGGTPWLGCSFVGSERAVCSLGEVDRDGFHFAFDCRTCA